MRRQTRLLSGMLGVSVVGLLAGATQAQEAAPRFSQVSGTIQANPAQRPSADMSLEELSHLPVTVASGSALPLAESPGIVSLVTRDEIVASGARDLIDVLRLVPGFEFGIDVRGVTSIGIRGNWAHEGKVLILWDGQMLNEILFPSVQLGNHFPVDLIERVEIIRGPGSAVYGGMAELGVIKIISRAAASPNEAMAITSFGWMADAPGYQNFAMSMGSRSGPRSLAVSLSAGNANRSDRTMTDFHPENPYHAFPMAGQETMDSVFLNIGAAVGGLSGRVIIDKYHLNDRTMYGTNLPSAPRIDFLTTIADLSYALAPAPRFRLTPRVTYTRNTPWRCLDLNYSPPVYLDKWAERFAASVALDGQVGHTLSVLSGIEYAEDVGHAGEKAFFLRDPTRKRLSFSNTAVYAQAIYEPKVANVTVGARFERNSKAGNSFVPRFALTREIGRVHFKALYSYAFRPPGIENISRYSSTPITPERTTVAEVEGGIRLNSRLSATVNLFDIRMRDPIVFFVDPILKVPAYHNATRTGTRGLEAGLRFKNSRWNAALGYSTYVARNNEVPDYVVTSDERTLLGFPRHKLTGQATVQIPWDASANVTGTYLSTRYVADGVAGTQFTEDPVFLLNAFVNFRKIFTNRVSIGVGIYNLLDAKYSFIQPYWSDNAPLPGPSREVVLRMTYRHEF